MGLKSVSEERLPLIKRYRKYEKYEREQKVNQVWADNVIFEYNSPKGFKSLNIENHDKNGTDIFASGEGKAVEIRFLCPEDWGGGEEEPCLRIRIIKANHCYEQPCIFNAPYISNMRISYTYDRTWCIPEKNFSIMGNKCKKLLQYSRPKRGIIII